MGGFSGRWRIEFSIVLRLEEATVILECARMVCFGVVLGSGFIRFSRLGFDFRFRCFKFWFAGWRMTFFYLELFVVVGCGF